MATVTLTGSLYLPDGQAATGVLEFKLVSNVETTAGSVSTPTPARSTIGALGAVSVDLEAGSLYDVTAVLTGARPGTTSLGRWTAPAAGVYTNPSLFDAWRATLAAPSANLRAVANLTQGLNKAPKRTALDVWTFAANMAKRASGLAAPLGVAVPVQGRVDFTAADQLQYPAGAQIAGNNYANANTNQGSIILLVESPFTTGDGPTGAYAPWKGWVNVGIYTNKVSGNTYLSLAGGGDVVTKTAQAFVRGSRYLLIGRWDADNVVSGSSYADLWVNNTQTVGVTSPFTPTAPSAAHTLGSMSSLYSLGGIGVLAACLTDYVLSAAEIAALYNSGNFACPSRVLANPGGVKLLWNPGLVGTTGAITGTLAAEGASVDQAAYNSGTNVNGDLVVNGGFEAALGAEWVATNATLTRKTDATSLSGLLNVGCMEVAATTTASGWCQQTIASLSAGDTFLYLTSAKKGTATSSRGIVYSGTAGSPTASTVYDGSTTSTTGALLTGCVSVGTGHDRLTVGIVSNTSTIGETAYFDAVRLYKSLLPNGGMEGTYVAGVAPGNTATGSPTLTESASGRYGKAQRVQAAANNDGITHSLTVTSGAWVQVGVWVNPSAGAARLQTTSGAAVDISSTSSSTGWQYLSGVVKTTATTLVVQVVGTANGADFLLDDYAAISLDSVDFTATPASEANSLEAGTGFRVDGGDTVIKPTLDDLSASAGTILLKFTPRGWAGNDGREHYALDSTSGATNLIRLSKTSGNILQFQIYGSDGLSKTKYMSVDATSLPSDTVARVGVRWNNGTMSLRLNTTDATTNGGSGTGVLSALPANIYLGTDSAGSRTVDSTLSVVRTYDRNLSDAELTAEMAAL